MGHFNIVNLIQTIEMTTLVTLISGPLVDNVLLHTPYIDIMILHMFTHTEFHSLFYTCSKDSISSAATRLLGFRTKSSSHCHQFGIF